MNDRKEHFGAQLAQLTKVLQSFPQGCELDALRLDQLAVHARGVAAGLEQLADRATELASVLLAESDPDLPDS